MDSSFLFLDESRCEETNITSLTGLLVPLPDIPALRSTFYQTLDWAIAPTAGTICFPPELHGREFLRDEPDRQKLQQFGRIVDLILKNSLQVFRVGYYRTAAAKALFKSEDDFLGLCWFGMVSVCQPHFADRQIIPVMDGFNPDIRMRFSGMIKSADICRAAGVPVSIGNSENIIGEVFYADSKYSVFTQIVDNISYLRHVADWAREGIALTDFKKQLLKTSIRLEPVLAYEDVIELKVNKGVDMWPLQNTRSQIRSEGETRM